MHYVYFLSNSIDRDIYVGMTNDVTKRLKEHNSGKTRSLKSKLPVKLVKTEAYQTKTEARKRELLLKRSFNAKIQALGPIV